MVQETAAKKAEREAREAELNPTPVEGETDHTADKGKFIAFKGHNGVRAISSEDWEAIGVKDQEGAQFDRTNAWRLPAKDFSDKALNYLLNVDGEFTRED